MESATRTNSAPDRLGRMSSGPSITVEGLGKRFLVPQRHTDNFHDEPSLKTRLKEFFPRTFRATEADYFWALKDVSFSVREGEIFGIVGKNGSGKSTLLKILSRVVYPTSGHALIHGRVSSLLEMGTGFHPDLTGRQNIHFSGSLLGVSKGEITERINDIIGFSGVGEFIDVPVKRYSSGMFVRLAFAVASLLDPEILILDEIFAVGDAEFQRKTEAHLRQATSSGQTVLMVSHNPQTIVSMCDRGLILDHGRVVFAGSSAAVIDEYAHRQ